MSSAYAVVSAALFSMLAYNIAGARHVGFMLSLDNWRSIVAFGLRMLTIGGVANLAQRLSELILGRLLGVAALGLYARASTIANMILINAYGTATRLAFAKLSQDHRDGRGVTRTFLLSLDMIIGILWPLQLGLAVLAAPVMTIIYGSKWQAAAPALSMLMIAQIVTLGFGMNSALFVINDEIKKQTRLEMIRAVLGTIAFSVGCGFSISAAATGRIAEAMFGLLLYLPSISRLSGASNRALREVFLRGIILMIVAVSPSLALMMWTHWDAETSWSLIFASVGLGGIGWLITLRYLDHPLDQEIHRSLRVVFPRLMQMIAR